MSNIFDELLDGNLYQSPEISPQEKDLEVYKAFESCLRTADMLNLDLPDGINLTTEQMIDIASAMLNYKGQLKQVKALEQIKSRLYEIEKSIDHCFDSSVEIRLGHISESIDAAYRRIAEAIDNR
ncbi:hypothetical protein IQ265_06585 [Nodosilinea sp. LEGE 06152]|uniref:hypothetical protein n=1 Tax=Nodosilinea sp. LEGE 06152 TaxID=2777966 RepID=UPI00187E9DF8|nr:hypothetical protein [Nodosilinea sp. LEGE 06152]MBE9156496.1 hypothetical protein [Nodosilinea sp. LEGE 06152]